MTRGGATDFLVVGAGIVGLTIARELRRRFPGSRITVLEKEARLAVHGSGRNSGVLHSGIYYPPGSLKARMCAQGASEMREFCEQRGLPLLRIGKVLVPVRPEDDPQLDALAARAGPNGVEAHLLDSAALAAEEPLARSASGRALLVPITSVCSPVQVIEALRGACMDERIEIRLGCVAWRFDPGARRVDLQGGDSLSFGLLVNAAGLHADRVAHAFGVAPHLAILPFKGIYWKLDPASGLRPRRLIYPVPDLRVPFLGVHTTTATDGSVYLGPTAIPAFGRENYRGVTGIRAGDAVRILRAVAEQFWSDRDGFRRLALQEAPKLAKGSFSRAVSVLVPRIGARDLMPCAKVGLRAQLYDFAQRRLVNDFVVERGFSSVHVLNAISPAWTCSFPFARHICDNHIEIGSP